MKCSVTALLTLFFVTPTALACFESLMKRPAKSHRILDAKKSTTRAPDFDKIPVGKIQGDKPREDENSGSDDYYNPIITKLSDDISEDQPSSKGLLKKRMKGFFKKGVKDMMVKHKIPYSFKLYLNSIAMPHALRLNSGCRCGGLLCIVCEIVIDILLELIDEVIDLRDIFFILTQVCIHMKIESKEVCRGAIELQAAVVLWIAKHRPKMSGRTFCATILQGKNCKANLPELNVTLPDRHSVPVEPNTRKGRSTSGKPLKIVQMTDAHYDPDYVVGGLARCEHPMCCSAGSGKARFKKQEAGYWGDYRDCDPPRHTLAMIFKHIAHQHPDTDLVYYTGDVVSHKLWDTTRETNARDLRDIFGDMHKYMPKFPCYGILGNHDAHPVNGFAPPQIVEKDIENNWLYKEMAEIWSKWLPADTKETILTGGYYTVLARPGFRIIAMNSNVVFSLNWWVLYETQTISQQLQWLADTLYKAEQNNEKVHILSHVPSGDASCYIPWGRQFRKIVERFHDTITGIFNGHTHFDEMLLYHDKKGQPISVAWNGGSLTNYANLNNNYKVYIVDRGTFEILDMESWSFELPEANKQPEVVPKWYKLYSFKEAYGLQDLSPKSVKSLITRLSTNNTLMQHYHSYKYRRLDWRGRCTSKCMEQHLCRMITQVHGDESYCEELLDHRDRFFGKRRRFRSRKSRKNITNKENDD